MRRRPSASGEDEDDSQSADAHRPLLEERLSSKSKKEMTITKETARASRQTSSPIDARRSPLPQHTRLQQQQQQRNGSTAHWSSSQTIKAPPSPLDGSPLDGAGKGLVDARTLSRDPRTLLPRSPWRCSFITLLTCLCSILIIVAVINSFLTRQLDSKGCAMSYMNPNFHHFADFDTEHTRFASKYSLYLYRERGVDDDPRVKGVPVLFIPGNAGSYRQMRPIAAEAANYFQDELRTDEAAIASGKRPFDFFTVDFNEELSAFHGQTLLDQAEYLNEAVAYILTLYHHPARSLRESHLPDPRSVIILGHSMGGVVARTMLRMPNYQAHSINTIITLAAPHARAPISFDADLVAAYDDINTYWRQSYLSSPPSANPLSDVTLVSVAGGGLDTTIASEFSSLTSLVPDTHGFTVFTSSIPGVWTGMDHLAIMWCDQFRKALVRAMFDIIDVRRASQTREQPRRVAALRRKLLTGLESVVQKVVPDQDPSIVLNLERSSTHVLSQGERLVLNEFGGDSKKAHILSIPAPTSEGAKFTLLTDHSLIADDEDATVSVFLCSVPPPLPGASVLSFAKKLDVTGGSGGLTKLSCKNVAADVALLPASTFQSRDAFEGARPFSYLEYDVADLADHQFMAVVDMATDPTPGWLIAEYSTTAESSILVSKGHHQLLLNGLQLTIPASRPMMTELKIPEVHSTMFAYNLDIQHQSCGPGNERFAPLLRQYIQEPYESKWFVNTHGGNINVHGISPYMPPPLRGGGASEGLSLQLWSDPSCNSTVEVSLKVDVLGSAGKLVMRYRGAFAAFPVLVVAIVLRKQFKVYDATGTFISFSQSMDQCLRTSLPTIFTALTFLAVAISKASKTPWASLWAGSNPIGSSSPGQALPVDFAVNDLMLGTSDPFFWFLVPLFGFVSIGICVVLNYACLVLTHFIALAYAVVMRIVRLVAAGRQASSSNSPTSTNTASASGGDRSSSSASTSDSDAPDTVSPSNPASHRLLTLALLLILIGTLIPYQFAYMVLTLVHLVTCVRALRASSSTAAAAAAATAASNNHNADRALSSPSSTLYPRLAAALSFENYTHSLLLLLVFILPINLPTLIVWTHNLAVHWLTPFSTHHNLLSVLPYILLVEVVGTGHMLPRVTSRLRYFTNTFIFALALYAAVFGVSYAYRLHHLANALCAWLFLLHLSNGRLGVACSPASSSSSSGASLSPVPSQASEKSRTSSSTSSSTVQVASGAVSVGVDGLDGGNGVHDSPDKGGSNDNNGSGDGGHAGHGRGDRTTKKRP